MPSEQNSLIDFFMVLEHVLYIFIRDATVFVVEYCNVLFLGYYKRI